jgi:hypothetical protein
MKAQHPTEERFENCYDCGNPIDLLEGRNWFRSFKGPEIGYVTTHNSGCPTGLEELRAKYDRLEAEIKELEKAGKAARARKDYKTSGELGRQQMAKQNEIAAMFEQNRDFADMILEEVFSRIG